MHKRFGTRELKRESDQNDGKEVRTDLKVRGGCSMSLEQHGSQEGVGGATAVAEANELRAAGLCMSAESYHWRIPSKPELVEKVVMQLKDRAESCGICGAERS